MVPTRLKKSTAWKYFGLKLEQSHTDAFVHLKNGSSTDVGNMGGEMRWEEQLDIGLAVCVPVFRVSFNLL